RTFATLRPRASTPMRSATPPSSGTASTPRPAADICLRPSRSSRAPTRKSPASMRTLAVALLGLLVLAGAACQSPSAPPPTRVELGAAGRAAAALEAGRYAEAVGLFREALASAPANVALRYGLAVALSYTDRGAAIREFQWVMVNARPGSQEQAEAQAWLSRAGALPAAPATPSDSAESERQGGRAVLRGRALFAEAGARPEPMPRLQLFLMGEPDSPTKDARYNLRTSDD